MANRNYQQTEMDLRTNLQQDVDCRVASVIDDTYDMLKDYNPPAVRNRHEAYGIAADNFTRISAKVKSVRNDMDTLLRTLANPNYPAVEAVSSLHNRVSELRTTSTKPSAKTTPPPRWNRQRQKMMVLKKPNPPTLKPTMKNK